jgi:hypothetical protein
LGIQLATADSHLFSFTIVSSSIQSRVDVLGISTNPLSLPELPYFIILAIDTPYAAWQQVGMLLDMFLMCP